MKLWQLTQSLETKEDFKNAQFAQRVASLAEAALLKSGVSFIAIPRLVSIKLTLDRFPD